MCYEACCGRADWLAAWPPLHGDSLSRKLPRLGPEKESAAAETATFGKESTQRWKAGMTVRAGSTPCGGILGTVPVPLEWPEQSVRLVTEEVSPQVRDMKYRTLEDGVKQMVITIPVLNPGETHRPW